MRPSRNAFAGLILLFLALPGYGLAQERAVVSKQVAVGRSEASLRLEFADGGELSLALRDGAVVVDDEGVGNYTPGDPVEAAWRALLGEAILLDDGPLAERLRAWSPPSDLQGSGLTVARRLDRALEEALTVRAVPDAPMAPGVSLSVGEGDEAALLRLLLGHGARLGLLGEALEGLGSNLRVHVDEDVEVGPGETLEGSLVVVQGDVRVEGTVEGDVVVVDGTVELLEGGLITGDVRLAGSALERDGGTLEGSVVELDPSMSNVETETRDRIREEIRRELRRELRAEHTESSGYGFFSPFGRVVVGIKGLIENAIFILIVGMVGVGLLAFVPDNLDVVADTARRQPGRAAMVGLAGTFLLIPVWVLGAVALAVSIVGIPVMIAWLPLFPLAAVAAAILGYLAVAKNVGEWLGDSDLRYTDWISQSNPMSIVFGGVAGLSVFFIAANVLSIVPFFGFVKGLLTFVGVMISLVAMQIGFGAVLLTRAGRRPEYGPRDFDAAWARAVDLDDDVDLGASEATADRGARGGNDA